MVVLKDKIFFLDRDGVINKPIINNKKPYSPIILEEFEVLPDVKSSLKTLRKNGFFNVIVTNQPNITNKLQSIEQLDHIHNWILDNLDIDFIKTCIHVDEDNCHCRKPKTGMLDIVSKELGIPLSNSYMIGDRWKDIACGQEAGCKEVFFINYNYHEDKPKQRFINVNSLKEAVQILISK